MKRRGVLRLLGGALAAGPSMAKEAVSSIASMRVPGIIESGIHIGGANGVEEPPYQNGTAYNHGEWLKERLLELTGLSDDERRERMENTWVQSFDPDLAVNRSFSISAKVLIQKKRNFEKELSREKRSLTRQIANFMKESG